MTGKKAARDHASERIVAIPIGMAICDIALGHLVLAEPAEKGNRSGLRADLARGDPKRWAGGASRADFQSGGLPVCLILRTELSDCSEKTQIRQQV